MCIIAQSVSTSYERSKSMYLSEIGLEKAEKGLQHIFDIEDEKVRKNIKDRRTNAADKRKIKIELVYEP